MSHGARDTVLLVDDDTAITDGLAAVLGRDGFDVVIAGTGEQALDVLQAQPVAVVVLDVMLPGIDGRETLRRIRAAGELPPVVMLTAIGESAERARTLDEGADDYLNKPFAPGELIARIRAVLRRTAGGGPPLATTRLLRAANLSVDRLARRFWLDGHEVFLTPRAAALLDYIVTHPDELLSRDRLLEIVWGFDDPVGTRAVDHRIAEIRRVLHDDPTSPTFIETVPGTGYRFRATVTAGP